MRTTIDTGEPGRPRPPMRTAWRLGFGAAIALILFGLLPLISAFGAIAIANLNGCTLHEGFTNPCVVFGADRGELLYSMFVVGWFGLLTLPIAALGVLLLATLTILRLVARWRRGRRIAGDSGSDGGQ